MGKLEIRREISNLRYENRLIRSKINQCQKAIGKLNDIYEKLDSALTKMDSADRLLESNIVNNQAADKGYASNSIEDIKNVLSKINNLINKIHSKINNYNNNINSNENRIAQLEYELRNMD